MSRPALLQRVLRNLLREAGPEAPLPAGVHREIRRERHLPLMPSSDFEIRTYRGPYANVYVNRSGRNEPHNISWNLSNEAIKAQTWTGPGNGAHRTMREVGEVLLNDVENYAPRALEWTATSGSRARLYDAMLDKFARQYGYSPTIRARFGRFARGRIRRAQAGGHEPPKWIEVINRLAFNDGGFDHATYKRQTLLRQALEDALVAGGPAALGYAVASEHDDDG